MTPRLALCALIALSLAQAGCSRKEGGTGSLTAADFARIDHHEIGDPFKLGKLDKIVVPQTTELSLIAEMDQIVVKKSGDFYIGDIFSQKAVFHFDPNGKPLHRYGEVGQGPGEYGNLISFDVDDQGRIFLLADRKIIVLERDGKPLKEIRTDFLAGEIKLVEDDVIVRVHASGASRDFPHSLFLVFDKALNPKKGLFDPDPRLAIYKFLPSNSMASDGGALFFTGIYEFSLNICRPSDGGNDKLVFGAQDREFESIWEKPSLTEEDRTAIRNHVKMFNGIYSFGTALCLIAMDRSKKDVSLWLVDVRRKSMETYPWGMFVGPDAPFSYLAGSYDRGLVFVIADEEKFVRFKERFPQYKNLEFGANSNPALVFLALDSLR